MDDRLGPVRVKDVIQKCLFLGLIYCSSLEASLIFKDVFYSAC